MTATHLRTRNAAAGPGRPAPAPTRRPARARGQGAVLGAVAVGGAVGAGARYGASLWWPNAAGAFPWTTLAVNVVGCALMGVLMAVSAARGTHRLVRPFLGTGVLGGFTTFSAYAVDVRQLVDAGRPGAGLGYLALTPLTALAAVWAATHGTRRVIARGERARTGTAPRATADTGGSASRHPRRASHAHPVHRADDLLPDDASRERR